MKFMYLILQETLWIAVPSFKSPFAFVIAMSATFHANVCDRLLQQQLPPDLQAAGVVVRNTFINFKKPVLTGARKRAQSEGANPILHVLKDEAGYRTPSLWGDEEQPMQVAVPIHFTVTDFVPNLNYGDQALIDYWLEQPDLTENSYLVLNTFIDFQKPGMTAGLEGGCRTPSLWGDEEQSMEVAPMNFTDFNVDCGASFMYAFDQSAFAANYSSPREADALECEVHQTTCDGTCTGCYWHTKKISCRWGDKC